MIDITERLSPAKGVIGVTVKKVSGEIVPDKCTEFEQVFTDYGFTQMYTGGYYTTVTGSYNNVGLFQFCKVGTSSTERVVTDVGLGAVLTPAGSSQNVGSVASVENISGKNYIKTIRNYLFPAGAFDNVTIREVGIFNANNNTTMMAGQTIKDGLGANTGITILVDEQLFVTYTFYIEVGRLGSSDFTNPITIFDGPVIINSVEYAVKIGLGNLYMFQQGTPGNIDYVLIMGPGAVGSTTSSVCFINATNYSNSLQIDNSCITTAYADRVVRQVTVKLLAGAGAQSIASLRPNLFSNSGTTIINFTPNLPKSASQTVEINYTHTIKWR